jgi:hypothetical protein
MQYEDIPLSTHVSVGSAQTSDEPGLGMQLSPGWPIVPGLSFRQYSSEPRTKQLSSALAHAGIVALQQGWPGCPQASHCEAIAIATQVFPALQDVPQHGSPAIPHPPPEELAPDELPPDELPPDELPPEELSPPLAASPVPPSEPASAAPTPAVSPPHARIASVQISPHAAIRWSRILG